MTTGRHRSGNDERRLLSVQVGSLKERIATAMGDTSTGLAASLAMEYLKLTNSAIGALGDDKRLLREVILLRSEATLYPKRVPKEEDPTLQLKWLGDGVSKLETLVRAADEQVGTHREAGGMPVVAGTANNGLLTSKQIWEKIEQDFGVSKRAFGKRINFVTDKFKRRLIFRDIEHSFQLTILGVSKPALVLAGGVIEELLRTPNKMN